MIEGTNEEHENWCVADLSLLLDEECEPHY